MTVLVAGGGIGGLALAQGLVRRGIDVVVVEPDTDLSRTGGYKLHLGPVALAALEGVLPPERMDLLLASAMGADEFRIALRDHRGRLLLLASDGGSGRSVDVDRVTLRLVLAEGLEDQLVTGRAVVEFDADAEGVRARLDDGTELEGSLLVIADGAGSSLAEHRAGRPTSGPTGLVGVAGRTPWGALPDDARELLADHPLLAIGPGGAGLFASKHDPTGQPAAPGPRSLSLTTGPVAIWGFIGVADLLPDRLKDVPPDDLLRSAGRALTDRRWHPSLVALLEHAEPSTVGGFRFLAADPSAIAPWSASRVTALGDAVHAMPPTGGQGAATAIRDAALLADLLPHQSEVHSDVHSAVAAYESQMREHAAAAVRESLQPVSWIHRSASPLGRIVLRAGLPVAAAAAAAVARSGRLLAPRR